MATRRRQVPPYAAMHRTKAARAAVAGPDATTGGPRTGRTTPAAESSGFDTNHGAETSRARLRGGWGSAAAVAAGVVLPVLRGLGIIDWPWALVLSPFTAAGVVAAVVFAVFFYQQSTGGQVAGTTPPPDHLEPPATADDADDRILGEHPEILAALCHGFRMKRFMPAVLGQSVTDPWGVYNAALTASATELASLRLLAALHTKRFADSAKGGRRPSDAHAMRAAIDAFHRCASKAEAGRGHPDCPFEHVTVIFGTRSPNRDANLRSVAPKVRALLERQYPQLRTARLADGSAVTFADWRTRASEDRAELARLRKEHERQERTVRDLQAQLAEERARVDALRDGAEAQRRQAHEAARAEQQRIVADLRAALDRAGREHARDRQRHETAIARLAAAQDALAQERDALELALLGSTGSADDTAPAPDVELSGVRVLLVGGDARQIPPLRERLESLGARLLHDDGVAAAEHVGSVQVVVFWIRYLSHATYFGVRQKVRAARTPHSYWMRTSPDSLVALIARTLADGRAPAAGPAIADRAASADATALERG